MVDTVTISDLQVTGRVNAGEPKKDKVFVTYDADFSAPKEYVLDFTLVNQGQVFGVVKSIFVDNGSNPSGVEVTVTGTNQFFVIPPYSTGNYIVNAAISSKLEFQSAGPATDLVTITAFNYEVAPQVWYSYGGTPPSAYSQAFGAMSEGANIAGQSFKQPVYMAGKEYSSGLLRALSTDANGALYVSFSGNSSVVGDIASDAPDSGNPVKVGGVYSANPVSVANGDRVNVWLSTKGATVIAGFNSNSGVDGFTKICNIAAHEGGTPQSGLLSIAAHVFNGTSYDRARGDTNGTVVTCALTSTYWNYACPTAGLVNTTAAVIIKTAAGVGIRNYLKTFTLDHDVLGAATEFAIRDGAGGAVLWRGKLQTPASEGRTVNFDPPLKGSANTLLEIVSLTAVTGGIYFSATGFTGA